MTAARNPFPQWLAEVEGDAIVICPQNIHAEVNGNLWSFSLTADQVAAVSVADVEGFASKIYESRRNWLVCREARPMTLYWWHDAQAGQLRFSLVSAVHPGLPFSGRLRTAATFREVANDWLTSPYLLGQPMTELHFLESVEGPDETVSETLVWSTPVP